MKEEIKAKIVDKINDLEAETILQQDMVDLLKKTNFTGEEAVEMGHRIAQLEMQAGFNHEYLVVLKEKYITEVV